MQQCANIAWLACFYQTPQQLVKIALRVISLQKINQYHVLPAVKDYMLTKKVQLIANIAWKENFNRSKELPIQAIVKIAKYIPTMNFKDSVFVKNVWRQKHLEHTIVLGVKKEAICKIGFAKRALLVDIVMKRIVTNASDVQLAGMAKICLCRNTKIALFWTAATGVLEDDMAIVKVVVM
jgi:hypothetical protein